MKTVGEVIALTSNFLQTKQRSQLRRDAEDLLAHILGVKRLDLYLNFERPIEETELSYMRQALARLVQDEPLQYIEGFVQFLDCRIEVSPNVLIPRPETEGMAHTIVKLLEKDHRGKVLWDICTGSGCLGISIKKKLSDLSITLSDISEKAIAIAKRNASKNDVVVDVLQGDLFGPFFDQKADFIVSNPPYVSPIEYKDLDRSVRDFEPKLALYAEENGLEFYLRFAKELKKYLALDGKAWFEIGSNQAEDVINIFINHGFKAHCFFHDLANHARGIEVAVS